VYRYDENATGVCHITILVLMGVNASVANWDILNMLLNFIYIIDICLKGMYLYRFELNEGGPGGNMFLRSVC
jgi:hypothetical protein